MIIHVDRSSGIFNQKRRVKQIFHALTKRERINEKRIEINRVLLLS